MLCAVFVVLGAWFAMIGGSFLFLWSIMSDVSCHAVRPTCDLDVTNGGCLPPFPPPSHPTIPQVEVDGGGAMGD